MQFVIPLALAAAPFLAQAMVEGGVKLLEKRKADLTFTTVAQGAEQLVKVKVDTTSEKKELDLANRCLIILRGTLGKWDQKLPENQGILKGTDMARLGLAQYPDFYYEAWLTRRATEDPTKQSE